VLNYFSTLVIAYVDGNFLLL